MALFAASMVWVTPAWAQEGTITAGETMMIFFIFIAAVISLFLYLARHTILQRRTEYDNSDYDSKRNRDYEKYHSNWQDDYEEYGERKVAGSDMPDYYGILGVPSDAAMQSIKSRYRELAKRMHPDVNEGSDTDMARINEAYEVLSDEQRRAEYDQRRD